MMNACQSSTAARRQNIIAKTASVREPVSKTTIVYQIIVVSSVARSLLLINCLQTFASIINLDFIGMNKGHSFFKSRYSEFDTEIPY